MPLSPPWPHEMAGRLEELEFESQALKDNPLGDPSRRPLWVYLPPDYARDLERRYPVIYVIQGLTGQVDMWRNRHPFRPNSLEATDDLFSKGATPPCLLAYVDAWTSLICSHLAASARRVTRESATRPSASYQPAAG